MLFPTCFIDVLLIFFYRNNSFTSNDEEISLYVLFFFVLFIFHSLRASLCRRIRRSQSYMNSRTLIDEHLRFFAQSTLMIGTVKVFSIFIFLRRHKHVTDEEVCTRTRSRILTNTPCAMHFVYIRSSLYYPSIQLKIKRHCKILHSINDKSV